jgi:hypothetical protein
MNRLQARSLLMIGIFDGCLPSGRILLIMCQDSVKAKK